MSANRHSAKFSPKCSPKKRRPPFKKPAKVFSEPPAVQNFPPQTTLHLKNLPRYSQSLRRFKFPQTRRPPVLLRASGGLGAVGGRPESEKCGFAYTKPHFGTHSRIQRIHRIHPKRCSELRLRPSLPHAPGARMTAVKQTPSKYVSFSGICLPSAFPPWPGEKRKFMRLVKTR